jgi:SAM-dependent MidA family methyltransferase
MQSTLRPLSALPDPGPDALAASRALTARIHRAITAAGGAIDFSRYMEHALYEPGLGYYTGGARKFGGSGDFTTAPELTPLFGHTLARTLAPVLRDPGCELLELGAGTGRLACDLLDALQELDALPAHYLILELSGELRARQHEAIAARHPALLGRIRWLDALPTSVRGAIIANEVLDVVPVHLVHWTPQGPVERCVGLGPGAAVAEAMQPGTAADAARPGPYAGDQAPDPAFAWVDRPIDDDRLLAAISQLRVPTAAGGYLSEVAPAAAALAASLVERLACGIALFIDYGFGRAEFYHPQRQQGTLMCHYRQHAHTDPFFLPGLQDITAHVDFTAVAEAAVGAGGRLAGYTTQAHFLLDAGIAGLLGRTPADQPGRYLPQAAAAQRLLSPAEMGELFKVITFARDCDLALPGLGARDLSRLL